MHSSTMKRNRNMSTCDKLDLKTLRYWPVMPKKNPGHCILHKWLDQQIEINLYVMEVTALCHSRKSTGLNHHVCTFNSIRLLASRTQMFKIEVFNALQIWFGLIKYTSLKTTLQNATPNWNKNVTWSPQYNLPVKHCS